MSYQPGAGYPDLLTIRSWVGVPATVIDDAQLNKVAGAEQLFQQSFIAWPAGEDLPDDGYQAFLRLVARHLAAKGIPLGMLGADAEYGHHVRAGLQGEAGGPGDAALSVSPAQAEGRHCGPGRSCPAAGHSPLGRC